MTRFAFTEYQAVALWYRVLDAVMAFLSAVVTAVALALVILYFTSRDE